MKFLSVLTFAFLIASSAFAAKPDITYFSCSVKEGKAEVTVKFAIKDLNPERSKGELVQYPGADEDTGMIFVSPEKSGDHYTMMSNLNGQGGDLRIRQNGDIYLFGDGDGYQYTDLVLFYDGEEIGYREGYVRDYGSAHGTDLSFKAFIACESSKKVL